MKKIIIIIMAVCLMALSVNAEIVQSVRVNQRLRMVIISTDQQGTHFKYFTEPGNGEASKFLGEEIFKDGEKVFDNYKEND